MSKQRNQKINIGITMGDPSGVGPALILKALKELNGLGDFTVIGDAWALNQVKGSKHNLSSFHLLDLGNVKKKGFSFGKVKAEYGRASFEYLEKSVDLIKAHRIDCLVTCPVSKEAINKAGIRFSGHTEYLARQSKTKQFTMMLLNEHLKISLISRHIPLKDVSGAITESNIHDAITCTYFSLKHLFNIKNPKIVTCGLNPHASDNGLIGLEENTLIKPALDKLRAELKVKIDGPMPSDAAISKAYNKEYDCVIAMYHDQALIPLKLFGSQTGVNITLGLPFVRTSPLHGTAFDIAANSKLINPGSFITAIKLAVKCALNQEKD